MNRGGLRGRGGSGGHPPCVQKLLANKRADVARPVRIQEPIDILALADCSGLPVDTPVGRRARAGQLSHPFQQTLPRPRSSVRSLPPLPPQLSFLLLRMICTTLRRGPWEAVLSQASDRNLTLPAPRTLQIVSSGASEWESVVIKYARECLCHSHTLPRKPNLDDHGGRSSTLGSAALNRRHRAFVSPPLTWATSGPQNSVKTGQDRPSAAS